MKVKMATYKQDLPPRNGFDPITWAARGPKRLMNGYTQLGLFLGVTIAAWVYYAFDRKKIRKLELEMNDARNAIEPFILAERERIFLKRLRRNRDEENELMKGVAGWETGTLWGEPVFHNVRGRFIRPSLREMLVHMDPKDQYNYIWDKMDR